MKKVGFFVLCVALLLSSCSGNAVSLPASGSSVSQGQNSVSSTQISLAAAVGTSGSEVVIGDKLFVAQTNDIYLNAEDYFGKTIRYEGIFKQAMWSETEDMLSYVIRYGPGCCGYDGEVGFEVVWDGTWPEEDAWCEAIGVLEVYEQDGRAYLRMALSSLKVLEQRGMEYVTA